MPNEEHLAILRQGAATWNKWRQANRNVEPDLRKALLKGTNLSFVDLRHANLNGAILTRSNLLKAKLTDSNIVDANLTEATLIEANLVDADLRNSILDGANFTQADLERANLDSASLQNADLSRIVLNKAIVTNSNLKNSILINADLVGTDLSYANLRNANLRSSNLLMTNFCKADLSGAILNGAYCGKTLFGDTDLSAAEGLESCLHTSASVIDIHTLSKSGELPLIFLRGCGLPETMITYLPSLLCRPIEFYSCFISYSSKDHEFAERLYADLQNEGVRCWFAPEDLKIGDRTRIKIDESIRLHDKLLLVLSRHSVESDWVEQEVETALERERQQKRLVLFPVRLDNTIMKITEGWPSYVKRTRNIGDFRKWKLHNHYRETLNRLLRDLKVEDGRKSDTG